MTIKPIVQKGLQILKSGSLGQIGRFTVTVPKGATSYDVISLVKNGNKINQYIFKDSSGKLLKSLKFTTDNKTMQTSAQARFYEYLDNPFIQKIKGVKEYKFNPNNECVGDTVWDFYHANRGTVRFSKNCSSGCYTDNFLRSDGTVKLGSFEIEPISMAEYSKLKQRLGKKSFVGEPWTPKESITSTHSIATGEIQECSVIGIQGKNGISLNHFNPNNEVNYDRVKLLTKIKEQLNIHGEESQAFVLGSVKSDHLSDSQFKELLEFLEQKGISTIGLKTGDDVIRNIAKEYQKLTMKIKDSRGLTKNIGIIDKRYDLGGQNLIFTPDGKIKLANLVIDSELESGNRCAQDLIQKSFAIIT